MGATAQAPEKDAEAVAWLEEWEERAAIMEHDGGLPRAEAEALAWDCVRRAAWRRVEERVRDLPS